MNGSAYPRLPSLRRSLSVAAFLAAFCCLWALASALFSRPFLPGPVSTFRALASLAVSGALARHGGASLFRVLWAIAGGFIPAAVLGLAAGRSRALDALVSPLVYVLHPLPKVAFLPIIMLLLGLGEASKVFLVAFIIFSQVLVSARDAAKRIPPSLVDAVRSLGAGRTDLALRLVLPATLPDLLTALRVSLGTSVAVLFLAETFATDTGLGYLIVDAWSRLAYPEMYAAIVALSLLGLALFILVDGAERVFCRYR